MLDQPGVLRRRGVARPTDDQQCADRAARTLQRRLSRQGEQGASLLMIMAKSRHKKPENVRRYFKPSPEAISELTSLLAPATADDEAHTVRRKGMPAVSSLPARTGACMPTV